MIPRNSFPRGLAPSVDRRPAIRRLALACVLAWALSLRAAEGWVVSTLAGTGKPGYTGDGGPATAAQLSNPYGLARGPDGALYICDMDNQVVRRLGKDNIISTVAGTGKRGYTGDGGPATRAELNEPYELRFAANGDLYFVEMRNHLVRKVETKSGMISTVAGLGQEGFAGDNGEARQASFRQPHSIQFDQAGNLYICDIGNHRIRRVEAGSGLISTFAGTGERVATPDKARFANAALNGPRALDFDREGNLWLALREGNAIYKLDPRAGTIHHQAGTGQKGFTGNGGPARAATLSGPKGISVGPDGNIFFADTESHSIRMLDPKRGTIELIAGTGERGDGPDGDARTCRFSRPHGISLDRDGSILVGDSENHKVRVIKRRP